MKKLTDAQEKAFRHAKHELELEGFTFNKEDEEMIKKVMTGEMTRDEMIQKTISNSQKKSLPPKQ
ncbi:hypothetical protein RZN25_07440 [Bacillaceae bacterium S4-13-56]